MAPKAVPIFMPGTCEYATQEGIRVLVIHTGPGKWQVSFQEDGRQLLEAEKGRETGSALRASRSNQLCQCLDFNPVRLILDF